MICLTTWGCHKEDFMLLFTWNQKNCIWDSAKRKGKYYDLARTIVQIKTSLSSCRIEKQSHFRAGAKGGGNQTENRATIKKDEPTSIDGKVGWGDLNEIYYSGAERCKVLEKSQCQRLPNGFVPGLSYNNLNLRTCSVSPLGPCPERSNQFSSQNISDAYHRQVFSSQCNLIFQKRKHSLYSASPTIFSHIFYTWFSTE